VLIHRCGGLDLFPPGGVIPQRDYTESLTARGIPFELLSSDEVVARWPQFRHLDGVVGLYQEDGGLLAAARATAAHQRLAGGPGAAILEQATVERVRSLGEEVEVVVDGALHRTQRLVVTAGAWSNRILGDLGITLPLEVTQEQLTYYAAPQLDRFAIDRFPIWIWMDEPCFYGFPVFGERGVKVAQDVGGPAMRMAFESNCCLRAWIRWTFVTTSYSGCTAVPAAGLMACRWWILVPVKFSKAR
jgi:sarcosine oxidase